MSSFGSLEIARSGLVISQKALDVVAQNITNANTTGYTRQRLVTVPTGNNMGVQLVGVEQVRDEFLDTQFRNETGTLGEWQVKTDALTSMEDYLQEPSDYGLNQMVSNFFSSLQEMAKQPEAKEMRTQVLQNGLALTDAIHYVYDKLTELQKNQNSEINTTVSQINTYAKNIQTLNSQIQKAEAGSSQKANELRDQRNNILDELSGFVNVSSTENSDGTVSVMIGSSYLVDKTDVHLISTTADKTNPIDGEQPLSSIKWEDGTDVTITGGKLKGYLDIRDGSGVTETDDPKYMGIPYFVDKLNKFAKTIVQNINAIHSTGYTMPNESNGNVSKIGVNFFTPTDVQNEVNAKNIAVSQEIMNNVYNIATSDEAITSLNVGNRNIMQKIADLADKNNLTLTLGSDTYNIGSFSSYTKEMATDLAIVSSEGKNRLESQQIIAKSAEDKRLSVSGVSTDEEMTNLIQFQHAYSAAARVMSAINENLDTLINSLGR